MEAHPSGVTGGGVGWGGERGGRGVFGGVLELLVKYSILGEMNLSKPGKTRHVQLACDTTHAKSEVCLLPPVMAYIFDRSVLCSTAGFYIGDLSSNVVHEDFFQAG